MPSRWDSPPKGETNIVKIDRGRYSPAFQVVRAWLSAASALVSVDTRKAVVFIDTAIDELLTLKANLRGDVL